MKIVVTSVLVNDQEKALRFHTDVLGFLKKTDIPMGHRRWLTLSARSAVRFLLGKMKLAGESWQTVGFSSATVSLFILARHRLPDVMPGAGA
jgi:catechol 2,3-dioxygenase-like lactoylglutathione lyase family enzyme